MQNTITLRGLVILALAALGACSPEPTSPPPVEVRNPPVARSAPKPQDQPARVRASETASSRPPAPRASKPAAAKPAPKPKLTRRRRPPAGRSVKWSAPITWVDFEAGIAQAKREGKPMLVFVYTHW